MERPLNIRTRYALQLIDTVRVGPDKAIFLTEGPKIPKDTLFYLESAEDLDDGHTSKSAKNLSAKPSQNGSPVKHKTAGGKVLRNKTRSAAQQEDLQTTATKIREHQSELHAALQSEGLAKYSDDGVKHGEKEGKGWKRFLSYKGEGALPKEVESLRVSYAVVALIRTKPLPLDFRRPQGPNHHPPCPRLLGSLSHQHHQECQQE